MKRRHFIRAGSAVTLPVFINGFNVSLLPGASLLSTLGTDSDTVLVLVQLDGGNDGLNTLIPLDQYSALSAVRQSILIPEQTVLPLNDETGLHPAMTGFRNLYAEGKLVAIQDVAYPNQNRSHFRSTDIWQSASRADQFLSTGWLGRYFDLHNSDYPAGYPNASYPDPFAITIRAQVSETCQGATANYSMAVTDPFTVYPVDETTLDTLPDTNFGREMEFLIDALRQTNAYADTILNAAHKGNNLSSLYNPDSNLAQQLRTVALLISGGLRTRVYVVRIGGFDTHANQVVAGSTMTGQHAQLLQDLSDAIYAFQDDLKKLGVDKRVLGLTFSEFGRQIASNDSLGTDHGTAAPMFVFGACVRGGIVGHNPMINTPLIPQEGVAMQHDFRAVYASVLTEWFKISAQEVQSLLGEDFAPMSLTGGCGFPGGLGDNAPGIEVRPDVSTVFPSPLTGTGYFRFHSSGEWSRISLYDGSGRRINVIAERVFEKGMHTLEFDTGALPQGTYHIRLEGRTWQEAKTVIKH